MRIRFVTRKNYNYRKKSIYDCLAEPARIFVDACLVFLEKRHFADCDLTEGFRRSNLLALIEQARNDVENFATLPPSDHTKFFLACLRAWKELTNR